MPRGANKGLARLAQIALRSHHQKFIKDVANDITRSATSMGISISGTVPLPTKKSRWVVPRSPFVNSRSQEHYQMNTHKRLIELYGESAGGRDGTAVVHFLRYLEHTIMPLHPSTRVRVTLFSNEELLPRDMPDGGGGGASEDLSAGERPESS